MALILVHKLNVFKPINEKYLNEWEQKGFKKFEEEEKQNALSEISEMPYGELKKYATKKGIEYPYAIKKDELIALIEASEV